MVMESEEYNSKIKSSQLFNFCAINFATPLEYLDLAPVRVSSHLSLSLINDVYPSIKLCDRVPASKKQRCTEHLKPQICLELMIGKMAKLGFDFALSGFYYTLIWLNIITLFF